jgi:hypothetical protein
MVRKKIGRRKGRKSKGFFYRSGRGWYSKISGKFVQLTGDDGERLTSEKTDERTLQDALARLRVHAKQPTQKVPESADAQVGAVIAAYLDQLRDVADNISTRTGLAKTYIDRGHTLYDFCYGLPGEFFCDGDRNNGPKR